MFARVKKSGKYQYLQIVENRKEKGKVKQRVKDQGTDQGTDGLGDGLGDGHEKMNFFLVRLK